ncbi:MAG: xanthine dehydrogenase accessory protein XdhC [Pseudomonadota bacterium]
MRDWCTAAAAGPAVRVLVAAVEGSAPREAGAAMVVTAGAQTGTIGGGALEWEAAAAARAMLGRPGTWLREERAFPLGPALGQCCGGAVRLLFERVTAVEADLLAALSGGLARPVTAGTAPVVEAGAAMPLPIARALRAARAGRAVPRVLRAGGWVFETLAPPARPVWLYGAGHVGRALVAVLQELPFDIAWVDTGPERFAGAEALRARRIVAPSPSAAADEAPAEAAHLVMTYSHALDLEICHRILTRDFAFVGLIGSETKAARFRSRLRALGVAEPALARLTCPIGEKALGKAPMAVAVGVAAELLRTGAGEGALPLAPSALTPGYLGAKEGEA